mgnify:FL=1
MRVLAPIALAAFLLTACSSEPQTQGGTGEHADSLELEASAGESASEVSGPIIYLDAQPGCFSLSADPTADVLIEGTGKEFYPRDCSDPHVLEIFWSGEVEGFSGDNNLTQEDARDGCVPRYFEVFGVAPPQEIIPQDEQLATPYIQWFFPDDGLEAAQFPGRLVCGLFIANDDYTRALSRTGSLLPNGA